MIYHFTTTKLIVIEESVSFLFYDALFCGYLICTWFSSSRNTIHPSSDKAQYYKTPVSTQFQTSLPICEPKITAIFRLRP